MKMLIKQALLLSGMFMTACQSTQPQEGKEYEMDCREQEKVMKKAANQTGIVRYNIDEKAYTIVIGIPNTIDSEDVGYVCNLPDAFKKDGLNVRFSGEYRAYDKVPQTMLGGQTFYYLKISQIKKI